jgi:hypothetical protein
VARASKIARRLLAVGVLAGLLLSGAVIEEGTASAGTTPVIYAAHVNGWHGYVKPGSFYFGNGGAPFITNLTWKSWGSKSAWGTGKIWTQKAGCSPSYKCSFSSRWVGISLATIKKHGAQPYYDRMAVEMRVGTKMHWFVGWFKYYPGATVPSWIFPLVWPYL